MAKTIENSHDPFCTAITTAVGCLTMSNISNIFATNKVLDQRKGKNGYTLPLPFGTKVGGMKGRGSG